MSNRSSLNNPVLVDFRAKLRYGNWSSAPQLARQWVSLMPDSIPDWGPYEVQAQTVLRRLARLA